MLNIKQGRLVEKEPGLRGGAALENDAQAISRRIAWANCPLLITGATGTGKGHLARWIHDHSARAKGPFVPVNCGAIPESLIDSHLFGHAKGSFSGAAGDHLGLIRAAAGGTLLFDEIGELPSTAQLRLLRLIEEREVQPVGHSKPMVIDVRIIAATNGDLSQAVRQGRFRQDLYFRLDVVRLHLKPLRERAEQIEPLIDEFNREFCQIHRQPELAFEDEAIDALLNYDWPGNIRELRTVIERLHVLCGDSSRSTSVSDLRRFGQLRLDKPVTSGNTIQLDSIKLDAVDQVLHSCRGNVSRAANALGVHRSTIYRWLADRRLTA